MISIIATLLMTRANMGVRAAKLASWGIVLLVAIIVLSIGKCTYDRRVIEKHSAKVEAADVKADAKGSAKAEELKKEITDANERAASAAAGSDDPLKSGFDSLRAETAGRN